MKKYILPLALFLIGIFLGGLFVKSADHFRDVPIQRDTIVCYDTMRYSRLDLSKHTYKIDVPKIEREMVFVETSFLDTIYLDNVQYVTMPREYYYTRLDDAEIWHSGVESRIDSLNIFRENVKITEQKIEKSVKNRLSVGMGVGYASALSSNIYLEYERMLHKNASFYARVLYDIPSRSYGFGLGAKVSIGW